MSLANSLSQAAKMNELASWNGRIFKLCGVEVLCAMEELEAEWKTCEVYTAFVTRCLFTRECITVSKCVYFSCWLL